MADPGTIRFNAMIREGERLDLKRVAVVTKTSRSRTREARP